MTNVLSTLVSPMPLTDPLLAKPSLEFILFSNQLSSHTAAADADEIWKDNSSSFGQLFCQKLVEPDSIVTQRISTCLLDRSLYERLTRLITLLPKQCIRNSVQQITIRPNEPSNRPQRPYNNEHRRSSNRPTFQQNSYASYSTPRYPNSQNPRPYSNQQGNPNGQFIDRRSQQPDRYSSYAGDQQYQPRGPPKGPYYNNSYHQQPQQQQPKRRPPASQPNNQQASNQNQNQQQRGNGRKGFGGTSFLVPPLSFKFSFLSQEIDKMHLVIPVPIRILISHFIVGHTKTLLTQTMSFYIAC